MCLSFDTAPLLFFVLLKFVTSFLTAIILIIPIKKVNIYW